MPHGTSADDHHRGATADWIWFGAAGDSTEFVTSDGVISTSLGQERDSGHNTRSYFRQRLAIDGVVSISVSILEPDSDSVPFTLTIRRDGTSRRGLRPTGQRATLVVDSRRIGAEFTLIPLLIASGVNDRSKWKAFVGTYGVALVDDSLYEFCRLPCLRPDTVELTPSAVVTRRF
jgi:hypothetical protein